jgi:hypothetical protein
MQTGLLFFISSIIFLAAASTTKILSKGLFSPKIANALSAFAAIILIYYFSSNEYVPSLIQAIRLHVFIIASVLILYFLFNFILLNRQQITLIGVLRFFVIASLGIILHFAAGIIIVGYEVIANIILVSFLFAAITACFYPLQYSKRTAARKIGKWIGTGILSKLVLGLVLAIYILFLRSYFSNIDANLTMIGEWTFAGVLASIAFLRLRLKLDLISAPIILEKWQKHQQELGFKTTDELVSLTEYVDAFLQRGEKSNLLTFLFVFLYERKVNIKFINSSLNELISYCDPPQPRIIFAWDQQLYEEKRLLSRKQVMDNTVKNLNADLFGDKNWT